MPEPAFNEQRENMQMYYVSSPALTPHTAHVLTDSTQTSDEGPSTSSSSSAAEKQENSNSSNRQHDEAKDTKDELKAPWFRSELRPFEDNPDQATLGSGMEQSMISQLMQLPEEPQHAADPIGLVLQEGADPEEVLTVRVPGFSFMGQGGGIVSFPDEYGIADPHHVGD